MNAIPCKGCGTEYERKVLYDVEGAGMDPNGEPEIVYICGPCYDEWIYGDNPWRDEKGLPV